LNLRLQLGRLAGGELVANPTSRCPYHHNEDKGSHMIDRTQVSMGTTWKSQGSRIRRTVAAVAMAGALALGVFGATQGQSHHATQAAFGSTWSAKTGPIAEPMGSTWS
jgi:hypothetical protein